MIKLLKTLLTQPEQLNQMMRRRKPSYWQIYFFTVAIMMIPFMIQMLTVSYSIKNDINQLEEHIPTFEIDKQNYLKLDNDSKKGFVYYSDTFNFIMTEEDQAPVRSDDQLISVEFLKSNVSIKTGIQDFSLKYSEYPELNQQVVKKIMSSLFNNPLIIVTYFTVLSFIVSTVYLFFIQFIYRIVLKAVSTMMGVLISPFAFKRLTIVLSVVPIFICALLNVALPFNFSYLGVGILLFIIGAIRVFLKTKSKTKQ
ncbi:DUF1189 family protein [Atopobacter phocae]|uniref:DUF1189 family protein n=1 Tax=Atopobacter phocae TaxID=136492 RepID=UPI000470A030|nr:DUF1189 family protein [Atopobacter phocae]